MSGYSPPSDEFCSVESETHFLPWLSIQPYLRRCHMASDLSYMGYVKSVVRHVEDRSIVS